MALGLGWWLASGGGAALAIDDPPPEPVVAGEALPAVPFPPASLGAPPPPVPVAAPSQSPGPPASAPPGTVAPPPSVAAELMARLLADPTAADLDLVGGRPLPLIEALERSGDRSRRLWITQAYWKAATALATVRVVGEGVDRLDLVAPGGAERDRDAVDAAAAAARADLAVARAELVAARQELADLVRLPPGEPLPWPIDRPLATPYQTHFTVIFAARPATGRIRAIDRMLPHRHAALEARGSAALAARRAVGAADEDHARGTCPVEAVLAAHARLVAVERDWAADVRAYNTDVAEYVMAVVDTAVPDDQFARMLIGTPLPWRPAASGPPQAGGAPQQPGTLVLVGGATAAPLPVPVPSALGAGSIPLLVPPPQPGSAPAR